MEEIKEIRERDDTLQSLDERIDDEEGSDEMMIPTEGVNTGIHSFKEKVREKDDDASDEANESCDEGVCDEVPDMKKATPCRELPTIAHASNVKSVQRPSEMLLRA